MPSIAARTDDDGTTRQLFGQRVSKDHPQIEAVGACDELNVALGNAKCQLSTDNAGRDVHALLTATQKKLVALMGELACAESDSARYAASKFEKIAATDVE